MWQLQGSRPIAGKVQDCMDNGRAMVKDLARWSLDGAYKLYRGLSNGAYYEKIGACAEKLKVDPNSMQPMRDMAK